MNFIVSRGVLLHELQLVQGIVERKSTIPILANLLMETGKEGLRIAATDLEVGIETHCEAEVRKPGSITLNARRLHDIVRRLPEAQVGFQQDEDGAWVRIECESIRYRIAGQPVDEFPALKSHELSDAVELEGKDLREMIDKVIFAITTDDPRYSLNGALMIVHKKDLTMVATDGHRLAYASRSTVKDGPDDALRVIVPRKTLSELQKLVDGLDSARFALKENQMFFEAGRRRLQSNILEGNFPNYEKVLPQENDQTVEIPTGALREALERVSLLSTERSRAVRIAVKPERVVLFSSSPEIGEATEEIGVSYSGREIEVGFNARYLLEMLSAVGTEKIRFSLKDEQTQGLLEPVYPDGEALAETYR
jgi:DNA polymerase-3 subunit beta